MGKLDFSSWLISEYADYGFSPRREPIGGTAEPKDANPVDPVDTNVILDELASLPLGNAKGSITFKDQVEWGTGLGSIRLEISPLGSSKVVARRQTKDLRGETVWICKYVLPLQEDEAAGHEISIAHKIHGRMEKVNRDMIDGPSVTCEHFEKLAWSLWNACKREHPSYVMFPVALKKMDEGYYKLIFEFRGSGVERPRNSSRAEQFNIDLYWDKNKGLLRCWGYDIDSSLGQHSWRVQPSEWDEYFSSAQPIEEIVGAVTSAFIKY